MYSISIPATETLDVMQPGPNGVAIHTHVSNFKSDGIDGLRSGRGPYAMLSNGEITFVCNGNHYSVSKGNCSFLKFNEIWSLLHAL